MENIEHGRPIELNRHRRKRGGHHKVQAEYSHGPSYSIKKAENRSEKEYMTQTNTDNRTEERKNRFNGESVMLTKEEARRHDCIFLAEVMATLDDKKVGHGASKHWDIMRKHLNWFRKHNAEAYMVLLD